MICTPQGFSRIFGQVTHERIIEGTTLFCYSLSSMEAVVLSDDDVEWYRLVELEQGMVFNHDSFLTNG